METNTAIDCLSALAHPHRLAVFRLLMRVGPEGRNAGDIATDLGLAPSSLSFHTRWLVNAGLITARRAGRCIFYAVDVDNTRSLIQFLSEDCCAGHPDLCGFDMQANPCAAEKVYKSMDEARKSR
jgi:ArsR family transcriptional regulator, arsenate/arsenite/antimonite-responsive transcriptional repressor